MRRSGKGIAFGVRVTARSARNGLDGTWTGADGRPYIKVRVVAAPHKGDANAAVVALIAKTLGVPKGTVQIVSGASGREKQIEVAGDASLLAARLGAAVAPSETKG